MSNFNLFDKNKNLLSKVISEQKKGQLEKYNEVKELSKKKLQKNYKNTSCQIIQTLDSEIQAFSLRNMKMVKDLGQFTIFDLEQVQFVTFTSDRKYMFVVDDKYRVLQYSNTNSQHGNYKKIRELEQSEKACQILAINVTSDDKYLFVMKHNGRITRYEIQVNYTQGEYFIVSIDEGLVENDDVKIGYLLNYENNMVCVYQCECAYYYQCFYVAVISDGNFVKKKINHFFPSKNQITSDPISNSLYVSDTENLQQISLTVGPFCLMKNIVKWINIKCIDAICCCGKGFLYVACIRNSMKKVQCKIDLKRCKIVSEILLDFKVKCINFDGDNAKYIYLNDVFGNIRIFCLKRKALLKILKVTKKNRIAYTKIFN